MPDITLHVAMVSVFSIAWQKNFFYYTLVPGFDFAFSPLINFLQKLAIKDWRHISIYELKN
jgi:hypothetical protein